MNSAALSALEHRNEVRLVGRVAAKPKVVSLASRDELVKVRLVVERPQLRSGKRRRAAIDTVDCVAWTPIERCRMQLWARGDVVEIKGSLRRRFWRSEMGQGSRFEVEVASVCRLAHGPDDRTVPDGTATSADPPGRARPVGEMPGEEVPVDDALDRDVPATPPGADGSVAGLR